MKKLAILTIFIAFVFQSYSSHYMGGEITWECLPNGKYRFLVKTYRECYMSQGNPAATFGSYLTLQTNIPGLNSFNVHLINGWPIEISPVCNSNPAFPQITCTGMVNGMANMGAVQEFFYSSDSLYPNGVTLNGVPPSTGWEIYYTSCCRNPSTNITSANNYAWWLHAIMYPYNNQNLSTCYDNSPKFLESPITFICSGIPNTFNHFGVDNDGDSLFFEWTAPLKDNGTQITTYANGYSSTSPYPGTTHNPNNVPATVDPTTGEIHLESHTNGAFSSTLKVSSFRNGIKIAEIFRDMQVSILSCGTNSPPAVAPPFQNNLGQYTLYKDTFEAGDYINFNISATDFGFLPNGTPQTIFVEVNGNQFGNIIPGSGSNQPTMDSLSGCLTPPCAKLTPAPNPPIQPLSGQFGIQTTFTWQTTCNHLSTNSSYTTYNFLFKVFDDFCPAPAQAMKTVSIILKSPSTGPANLHTANLLGNGNITLAWQKPTDPKQVFHAYVLYRAIIYTNNFQAIDTITNINQLAFTDTLAHGNISPKCYYIKTISGCNNHSFSYSDTLCTGVWQGIQSKKVFDLISCIPNPANDNATITFFAESSSKVVFSLKDISGKTILEKQINAIPGENRFNIDLSKQASGLYFYSLYNEEKVLTEKLIISK
jgi:hypothetical protein